MNSSQVGVFKEGYKISLGGLLKCHDGRRLEAQVGLQYTISMNFDPAVLVD